MKKQFIILVALCLSLTLLAFQAQDVQAKSKKAKKVAKAYTRILKRKAYEGGSFIAKDVNRDGVKELIAFTKNLRVPDAVYTYYKGQVRLLRDGANTICHNSFNLYQDRLHGWLVGDNSGTTETYYCYSIKKGFNIWQRNYTCHFKNYNAQNGLGYFISDGRGEKQISKLRFKAYVKTLKKLKAVKNTKKNRKKYL